MITGIGVDLVEVARVRKALERHGERFLNRIYRPGEVAYSRARAREFEHFAARFAAKEAVLKALGTGAAHGATMRDVEVVNNSDGKPEIVLHGRTKDLADARGVVRIHVSLAHADAYAMAQAVMESGGR